MCVTSCFPTKVIDFKGKDYWLLVYCLFIADAYYLVWLWFKSALPVIIPVSDRRFFFLAAMCMIFFIWFEKERDSFLEDHWGFFIYLFQRTLLHYVTSQRSSLSLKHLYCNLSYLLGSIILLVLEIVLQVNVSAGESFYSYNSNSLENWK